MSLSFRWSLLVGAALFPVAPRALADIMQAPPDGTIIPHILSPMGGTCTSGTNVQASAPEARDALERGVADEITFPWGSVCLFGIDKVVKYHMDVPLY